MKIKLTEFESTDLYYALRALKQAEEIIIRVQSKLAEHDEEAAVWVRDILRDKWLDTVILRVTELQSGEVNSTRRADMEAWGRDRKRADIAATDAGGEKTDVAR